MQPGDPGAPPLNWWITQALEADQIISNRWREVEGRERGWASDWGDARVMAMETFHDPASLVMCFDNGNALKYADGRLYTLRIADCDPDELAEMYDFFDEMNRSRPD